MNDVNRLFSICHGKTNLSIVLHTACILLFRDFSSKPSMFQVINRTLFGWGSETGVLVCGFFSSAPNAVAAAVTVADGPCLVPIGLLDADPPSSSK